MGNGPRVVTLIDPKLELSTFRWAISAGIRKQSSQSICTVQVGHPPRVTTTSSPTPGTLSRN